MYKGTQQVELEPKDDLHLGYATRLPKLYSNARYKVPLILLRVMAGSSGVSQPILLKRQIVERGFGYGVFTALNVLCAANGAFPHRISLEDPSHEKIAPKLSGRQMVQYPEGLLRQHQHLGS